MLGQDSPPRTVHRRRLLGGIVAVGTTLAGCLGTESSDGNSNDTTTTESDGGSGETSTTSGTNESSDSENTKNSGTELEEHSAAAAIDTQPVLGPSLTEAEGVIIEFADPSCPGCARFEQNTFPKIKSELVESGRVAFVYREYPNVAPWGEPASQALEGTYAQSEQAFWALKSYYYENTDSLTEDNVLEKTEAYLEQHTDVDAGVVVDGVRNDEFTAAVQQDVDAGDAAGVSGTPSFFLFRSGSFVTKIEGAQDYSVFKNALGYS